MILSFQELGIIKTVYNGIQFGIASTCIINIACDYCMQEYFPGLDESDCLLNVINWDVDFLKEEVIAQIAPIVYKPFH